MPTKDLGNGFQIIDTTNQPDQVEQYQKQLGLADLMQRVAAGPVEQKIKEADLLLKSDQVQGLQQAAELRNVQLETAKAGLQADKLKFANDALLNIHKAFTYDFETGAALLGSVPGALAKNRGDGTAVVSLPGSSPMLIKVGKINDPETVRAMQKDARESWQKMSKEYQEIYTQNNNISSLLKLGTGQADLSAIYAMAKMQDPGGRVTDGDYNAVMQSPNISAYVKNMLTRAVTEGGPVFGPPDSKSRTDFLNTARVRFENAKTVFQPQAQAFYDSQVKYNGLDPQGFFTPAGDITLESLAPKAEKQDIKAPGAAFNQVRAPQEAAAIAPNAPPKSQAPSLDELTQKWQQETFKKPLPGKAK